MKLEPSEILAKIIALCPSVLGDPTVDMNSVRSAEEAALKTADDWGRFVKALGLIFQRDQNGIGTWEIFRQHTERGVCHGIVDFLRATPLQRCEAILRVRGLWPLEKYETPELYLKPDIRLFNK